MSYKKIQFRLSLSVLVGSAVLVAITASQRSAIAQGKTEAVEAATEPIGIQVDIRENENLQKQNSSEGLPVLSDSDFPVLLDSEGFDTETYNVEGRSVEGRSVESNRLGYGWSSDYRLGPGDVIEVSVFQAEEYGGEFIVLQDGSILLPRVGKVFLEGYTLQQTTELLAYRYAVYIKDPVVSLSPVQFRPVRIGIAGEVGRPGSYVISGTSEATRSSAQSSRFPTLTQAIAEAGGIAAAADLSSVEVTRTVGPGVEESINVNLWDLIQSGSLEQDVILQSGDQITIPTAVTITPEESQLLAEASFAPDSIRVYVAGEVDSPGVIELPLNSPLNQALLAAGSFNSRANRDTIELVRVNPDGTTLQERFAVDIAASVGEPSNPTLRDQDVIVVERSGLARVGDAADILLSPVSRVLSAILGISRLF